MTQFQERLPNDQASLIRRIEALEREVQQARAARRLEAATIGAGGVTVKDGGSVRVLDGGTLEVESGTLILGDQVVRSGALAVAFDGVDAYEQAFSIIQGNGSYNPTVAGLIPIPEWATSGILHVFAHASVINTTASADTVSIAANAYINPGPVELYQTVSPGSTAVISNSSQRTFDKEVGDGWTNLEVGATLSTIGATWPATANNRVTLSAMAIFKA